MILKIIVGALTGTSIMTAFSYIVSKVLNRQFREPVLLNHLVYHSSFAEKKKERSQLPGWLIHYGMGLTFTVIYFLIWINTGVDPTLINGLLLGFANGLVGIAGWHLAFKIHTNEPEIHRAGFYLHLLVAHVFFGGGVVAGYNLISV